MVQPKKVLVYNRPGAAEDGMAVRPTHKLNLDEGVATIKELLEDFRVLVQFDDPKVRPNYRELKPEEIGAHVITQEAPKPPLGLMPRQIWIAHRMEEIREAIKRYEHAKHPVPRAWRSELQALQGSMFVPLDVASQDLSEFAQRVEYQPAYSVEQLDRMKEEVLPFLSELGDIDVMIVDNQLVDVSKQPHEVLTAKFEASNKNFAYLCAFLLNNARNILLRK
jgi:hypothetical protein